MIGRVLWWLLCRVHPRGVNVTEESLDALEAVIAEEAARMGLATKEETT